MKLVLAVHCLTSLQGRIDRQLLVFKEEAVQRLGICSTGALAVVLAALAFVVCIPDGITSMYTFRLFPHLRRMPLALVHSLPAGHPLTQPSYADVTLSSVLYLVLMNDVIVRLLLIALKAFTFAYPSPSRRGDSGQQHRTKVSDGVPCCL